MCCKDARALDGEQPSKSQKSKKKRGSRKERFEWVRRLQQALGVDRDTARGLVTKLKRKKLLPNMK
jgi:hypothetical protein